MLTVIVTCSLNLQPYISCPPLPVCLAQLRRLPTKCSMHFSCWHHTVTTALQEELYDIC